MLMCLCSMTDFWRQMLQNKLMSHFLQHLVWVQTGKQRSKFYCLGDFFSMWGLDLAHYKEPLYMQNFEIAVGLDSIHCQSSEGFVWVFWRGPISILVLETKPPKYTYERKPPCKYATYLSCAETISGLSALQVVTHALTPIVFSGLHVWIIMHLGTTICRIRLLQNNMLMKT